MKGIILAGGSGTRLHPLTSVTSKQLLPVYDKPMIFYPLSTLMLAGIKEILIISTPSDLPNFKALLGDGEALGIKLSYKVQPNPEGLAQAFILGEEFIGDDSCAMILGDNIFYGNGFSNLLQNTAKNLSGATIFGYAVNDPERFGVLEIDTQKNVLSIEEKPTHPKSNFAATGLYFYDNNCVKYAKSLKPSPRGELEITDLNKIYLEQDNLKANILGRGYSWIDTGTIESLFEASNFIRAIEKHQGVKVSVVEEVAYRMGYINKTQLIELADKYKKSPYGVYLSRLAEGKM